LIGQEHELLGAFPEPDGFQAVEQTYPVVDVNDVVAGLEVAEIG
jgi:hypothetical protein